MVRYRIHSCINCTAVAKRRRVAIEVTRRACSTTYLLYIMVCLARHESQFCDLATPVTAELANILIP